MKGGLTAPQSLSRGVALFRRIASEYVEGGADDCRCTLMVGAVATARGLGVHLDGRVTSALDEIVVAPELEGAIRSDPAAFRQFLLGRSRTPK
jgi:hypothetical protein